MVFVALSPPDIIATAGVVVSDGGKVLLIEHGEGAGHITGAWGIPAGAIDDGETPIVAAVRELAEETGLLVDAESLIELPQLYEALIDRKVGDAKWFSLRAFATDRYTGELASSAEGRASWVDVEAVPHLKPLLGNTADVVEAAVQALRR